MKPRLYFAFHFSAEVSESSKPKRCTESVCGCCRRIVNSWVIATVYRAVIQAAVARPVWSASSTAPVANENTKHQSRRQTLILHHRLLLSLWLRRMLRCL